MTSPNVKRHWRSRLAKFGAGLALLSVLNSCAHESTRQLAPGLSDSGISRMRSFYVRQHADDDYKLGAEIATSLQEMGYRATTGSAHSPPGRVDAVFTYTDKWNWDMTMYMISLDIQLREPASDATLATAKTLRSSLVRKSQKEMVRETLTKLLKNS